MTRRALYGMALGLLMVPLAGAATICVNPSGGTCQATIQNGVDLAAAGDTVKIATGTYFENVNVPAGKDGLRITGSGKTSTILDPDAPNLGTAITVASNNVKVSNLQIRNGQFHGITFNGVNNGTVQGVRIVGLRNPSSHGILLNGGTGHQIIGNEIRAAGFLGIYLNSTGTSVAKGNTVVGTQYAFIAWGTGNQLLANKISNTSHHAIYSLLGGADLLTVAGNTVENGLGIGMEIAGANPLVESNKFTVVGGNSLPSDNLVDCLPCSGGSVKGNTVLGSQGVGLSVNSNAAGLVVQGNKISQTGSYGLIVDGNTVEVDQNTVSDTMVAESGPGTFGACFYVKGAGHTLTKNTALRCGGEGFNVNGNSNTLILNLATNANSFGFLVDGYSIVAPYTANTLTSNKAVSANGQGFGIINAAANTTLTTNGATKGRVDYCHQGDTGTTLTGNAFAVTSTTCDILQ